jgi:hypothetical protein
MTLAWQPIHPDKSRLLNANESDVRFAAAPVYSGLAVTCYHFGLDVMLDLQFPFGNTKGKTNVQYFVLEMAAYTPGVYSAEVIGGRLFFLRKGVGFRVGVASWDVAFTAASNLASVAASGAVKTAKTNINVQAFGGDAITTLKIFERIQTMGGLSPETLRAIAMAGEEVADVMSSGEQMDPKELLVANVDVGVTGGWMEVAYSLQFAVESIFRRKSLLTAYQSFAKKNDSKQRELFNLLIPRAAYVDFGLVNEAKEPTEKDKTEAELILKYGR